MAPASALDDRDLELLRRAADLGERGRGFTHPNPVVGCLVVRDGRVVGRGFHEEYGGPHAEVLALADAGERCRGATAYVSLEPCAHEGRTGPCTVALREAGIRRVVFGARDPGPGRGGADALRAWGVEVLGPGFDDREARARNPAFHRVHGQGRPFVALKLSMSLDARIARGPGQRTAITGPEANARVHRLRREFDGILVGAGTARADDPLLTVRDGLPVPRPPARIVVDSRLTLTPDARLFTDPSPVHVFCGSEAPGERATALEAAGARVHRVATGREGLDTGAVLSVLWDQGIRAILCEGGGRLGAGLLADGRVQRLYLFLAPAVLGDGGVPAFPLSAGPPGDWTASGPVETFGRDALIVWDREEDPA